MSNCSVFVPYMRYNDSRVWFSCIPIHFHQTYQAIFKRYVALVLAIFKRFTFRYCILLLRDAFWKSIFVIKVFCRESFFDSVPLFRLFGKTYQLIVNPILVWPFVPPILVSGAKNAPPLKISLKNLEKILDRSHN